MLQARNGWLNRLALATAVLLLAGFAAWIVTVLQSRTMGIMPGTMGMSLVAFVLS
jgi:hypothetical protein